MGFNKRKMEDQRQHLAEKEAKARRATEKQILEGADHLITVWNERQAKRMPMLFSPTIGAAITAGYWFLRANATIEAYLELGPRGIRGSACEWRDQWLKSANRQP
jgi:hypothetical protein